jgi:radical SAM superfamily enzyme YgiQ (UPF0313 family)
MRVGVIFVYVDYNRKGERSRGLLQPQIAPLIAALLPPDVEIDLVNETWDFPAWDRDYDLLFITCAHSDFDRARQISHYWRRRGAKTVFGGALAGTYPELCLPYFDAICIGDAESTVPDVYRDFTRRALQPIYYGRPFDPASVPTPRLDLLYAQQRLPLSIEVTRGCPFSCEFCVLTAMGTRFHTRPVELVMRDLDEGRRMLKGLVPPYMLAMGAFYDNNIGGHLPYLRRFCEELSKRRFYWGTAITFNAICDEGIVKALSRAGCRFLFVGLESFNPATIADMRKHQNRIDKTRSVLDMCRKHGILVQAGLMLSATTDDPEYIASIPGHLERVGLHLPTFICFESPIPGTPYFHSLAAHEGALMPETKLYDYTGYSMVVRPQRTSLPTFVQAYTDVLRKTYTPMARLRKLWTDVPSLLAAGFWDTAMVDVIQNGGVFFRKPHPARTYTPVTDVIPPELSMVPLTDLDFDSEAQRRDIMEPWNVTDAHGRLLPQWRRSQKVHVRRGEAGVALSMV